MTLTFDTEVLVTVPGGPNPYPWDDYSGKVQLKWELILELRGWGLKSVCILVPPQKISCTLTSTDGADLHTEKEFTLDVQDVTVQWFRTEDDDINIHPEELQQDKDGNWTLLI